MTLKPKSFIALLGFFLIGTISTASAAPNQWTDIGVIKKGSAASWAYPECDYRVKIVNNYLGTTAFYPVSAQIQRTTYDIFDFDLTSLNYILQTSLGKILDKLEANWIAGGGWELVSFKNLRIDLTTEKTANGIVFSNISVTHSWNAARIRKYTVLNKQIVAKDPATISQTVPVQYLPEFTFQRRCPNR